MPGRSVEPVTEQPLGVIDLLDGSFAVIRQRARVVVGVVAGLVIPVSLFEAWIARDDLGGASFSDVFNDPTLAQNASDAGSVYDASFVVAHGLGLAVTAAGGLAVSRIIGGWLQGRDEGALAVLRFTLRRAPALAGAFVLIHLIQLVGFVLAVVPGLIAIVACSLTSPVLALEELGPVAAVKRSWELVRRRPAPVLFVILLVAAVQYGVNQAVGTVPQLVALFLGPDRTWPLLAASNAATSLILVPVTGAAMCLTYLDVRFRTEGLDLYRRIGEHFGPTPGPATRPGGRS